MDTFVETMRLPENFVEYDGEEIMSNFDNSILEDVAAAIKDKNLYSRYSGWNFNGIVWWQEGGWYCEIWRYKEYKKTFTANSLQEIKSVVCDEYGYE